MTIVGHRDDMKSWAFTDDEDTIEIGTKTIDNTWVRIKAINYEGETTILLDPQMAAEAAHKLTHVANQALADKYMKESIKANTRP